MSAEVEYSKAQSFGALIGVVLTAAVGGLIFELIFEVMTIPRIGKFKGCKKKQLIHHFSIPPLLGMIIMGCVARNFFGSLMDAYQEKTAALIRSVCLANLIARGGLNITFSGKGILLILMAILPQAVEANVGAWIAKALFEMPTTICYCLSWALSNVALAVIVPGLMHLHDHGYGVKKGIVGTIISPGIFDNILCVLIFGIVTTLAFMEADEDEKGNTKGLIMKIVMILVQIAVGAIVGTLIGLLGWFFNKIQHFKYELEIKAIWVIFWASSFVITSQFSTFIESRYIACLMFGYFNGRFWKTKPAKHLSNFWIILQYFLFGTVGGALKLSTIKVGYLGYGIIIILVGLLMRVATTFFISVSKKYTIKERILFAISWIPKATVPAALSSVVLREAKDRGLPPQYIEYGEIIQTTAIISILIAAPLGVILLNALGHRLLTKDFDIEIELKKQAKGDPVVVEEINQNQIEAATACKRQENGMTEEEIHVDQEPEIEISQIDSEPKVKTVNDSHGIWISNNFISDSRTKSTSKFSNVSKSITQSGEINNEDIKEIPYFDKFSK